MIASGIGCSRTTLPLPYSNYEVYITLTIRRQSYGSPSQWIAQASSFPEGGPVHHMSSLRVRKSLSNVNDATDSERDKLMAAWLLAEYSEIPLRERVVGELPEGAGASRASESLSFFQASHDQHW